MNGYLANPSIIARIKTVRINNELQNSKFKSCNLNDNVFINIDISRFEKLKSMKKL